MITDITIGQFFPAESIIHRLDPRTKILLVLVYVVVVFFVKSFVGYMVLALFVISCCAMARVPVRFILRGLKPIMFFIVITALFNLFLTSGGVIIFHWWIFTITDEGLRFAVFMVLRLLFLIMGTSLLTLTTSPILLTDGMERLLSPFGKIGVPAHEISMMMTIALRFIPTLLEETDKIIKAQSARGADFDSGNLIRRAKAMVPILIPLFISSFRRADELATAMECRCYRGGKNRTRLNKLEYGKRDALAWLIFAVFTAAVFATNFLFAF